MVCYKFYALLFIVLVGCNNSKELNTAQYHFDVSNLEKQNGIPSDIIKKTDFIALETNRDVLLGVIKKLFVTKDRIFVLDNTNMKVFIFNTDGKFLTSLGKNGKGPGELLSLLDFVVDEEKNILYVLDSQNRKVLLYDIEKAKFLSDFKIKFLSTDFEKINNNLVFYVLSPGIKAKVTYAISILNLDDKSFHWYLKKDGYYTGLSGGYSIFKSEKTFFVPFLKDIVYNFNSSGLTPYIQFDFGQSKIPEKLIINASKSARATMQIFKQNEAYTYGIENVLENESFITFNMTVKGNSCMAIFSKDTKNIFFGNHFGKGLEVFGLIKNFTVSGNKFVSVVNANFFTKMEKKIIENGDPTLREEYLKTIKHVDSSSNPILITLEFNTF